MAINPASLLQRSRLSGITDFLKNQQAQSTIAATAGKYATPIVKSQEAINRDLGYRIPDAGQFGGPATLPSNPGPPDPIMPGNLPGANLPNNAFGPASPSQDDIWTRMDPGMGYINPSLTINPSDGGSVPYQSPQITSQNDPQSGGTHPPLQGGGSPFMSGAGQPVQPQAPAWFQPGYRPSAGIQNAISRGDYSNAYGQSQSSIDSGRIMASQAYGGNANNPGQGDFPDRFYNGIMRFDPETGQATQVGDRLAGVLRPTHQLINSPEGIAAYNNAVARRPAWGTPVAGSGG